MSSPKAATHRKWNRDRIRKTLVILHRAGEDLSYNAMARRNQALVSAANYHFGSYRRAVEMAGLDYTAISRKPRWTREKIIAVIRSARRAGRPLNWRAVSGLHDELGQAATAAVRKRMFGSWNAALAAAGLNPRRIMRYHRWDQASVQQALQARIRARKHVNSGIVQCESPGLYSAAVRFFGSYDAALARAGINAAEVRRRREWSRDEVVRRMAHFAETHGTLATTHMRRHDPGLERAIRIYFKSVARARQNPSLISSIAHPGQVTPSRNGHHPARHRRQHASLAAR